MPDCRFCFWRILSQTSVFLTQGLTRNYRKKVTLLFFASLECELIDRHSFRSKLQARLAVFDYIEGFYNPHRRHSSLDYLSPINYESRHSDVA